MKKKIIGYTRVSTREQVEGFSLAHQEKQIYIKVDMLGLTKRGINIFSEEGVSAKNFNRPKIKEAIEQIKNGEVEMIIIYKFDRLTRSMVDLVNFIELCDKNNVSLISVHENLDMSTPIGRMQANMIGALAQFEREQISIRTIDGLQEKASQGQYPLGNKVPYGYRKDGEHKLYIVEDEVQIIKKLMKYYAYDNLSEYVASEIINEKHNKYFSPKNIKSYLSKDLFKGFVVVGGKEFHIVEPIFSAEDIKTLERRRELHIYTKQRYKFFNKIYINDELAYHETTKKKNKRTGDVKSYPYYSIKGVGRIGEASLTKLVLKEVSHKEIGEKTSVDDVINKLAKSLCEGTITKKQFDDLYEKEEKRLKKFTSKLERIDLTFENKELIDWEVKVY
ncbi:MAG: recombinase family protein [Bacilli bacterium]